MMVTLANGLSRQSTRAEMLLFNQEGVYFDELDSTVGLQSLNIKGRFSRLLGIPRYWRYIRRSRPSAVIISGHSSYLVGLVAKLFTDHRIIVVVHNTVSREGRLSSLLAKYLYRFADPIVAVSHGVARDLSRYTGIDLDHIQVIYNAVDINRIEKAMEAPPQHPWMSDPSVPVVLGIGRLMHQKRFDLLLHAIARVRAKRPVRLILLGQGPLRRELGRLARKLRIEEDVHFAGFVKNPYVYMRDASLFVLTSDFEGFAVVLIEALACGCPVISTACNSGPNEILEGGRWGTLVPVGDVKALTAAIERTLTEPPARKRARVRAEAFSAEEYVRRYWELIDAQK